MISRLSKPDDGSARGEPVALEIPDWVPVSVAQFAMTALHASPQADPGNARLKRLIYDSRMKKVWDELRRPRRDRPEFINPAWKGKIRHPTQDDQLTAMVWLLQLLLIRIPGDATTRSVREIEAKKRALVDARGQLRRIAEFVLPFSIDVSNH